MFVTKSVIPWYAHPDSLLGMLGWLVVVFCCVVVWCCMLLRDVGDVVCVVAVLLLLNICIILEWYSLLERITLAENMLSIVIGALLFLPSMTFVSCS